MNVIKEKLKLLPDSAGVYLMLDSEGSVIYVGKAKVLKNRVRQYFHSSYKGEKVEAMVAHIADFNYIVTASELDALCLENNLIKKYQPKYNILLKDDKNFPYIKLNTKERYPTFSITRRLSKGAKYFGPYLGGVKIKDVLELVQLAFSVKTCTTAVGEKPKKECLNYHIKRCLAPCAHLCTQEQYADAVKKAVEFLEGDFGKIRQMLTDKMNAYSQSEEFEQAIICRERLSLLDKMDYSRVPTLQRAVDVDVISYATNELYSVINILMVRKGIMQGALNFPFENGGQTQAEALISFCVQYYANKLVPSEIIISDEQAKQLLEEYFKEKLSKKVVCYYPKNQGVKKNLLQMSLKNSSEYLQKYVVSIQHKEDMTVNACERLRNLLNLSRYPKRMECYDISNISGVDKVGSMVVFSDGAPDKSSYRRFKIKTVEGANDFESLKEVLMRRLSKLNTSEEERFPKPDLIIIDGGKGQLSSVKQVFDELKVDDIDLISLAKREEEVFTPNLAYPIVIDKTDYSLKVLQRIRDEAHRFAITYFRSLHSKRTLASVLDEIEGVGKVKKAALLERFKGLSGLLDATVEDISAVEGIGSALADLIYSHLRNMQ